MKKIAFFLFFGWASLAFSQELQVLELEKGVSKAQIQLLNDLSARKRWLDQQAKSSKQIFVSPDKFENEELSSVVQLYLYMSPVDSARLLSSMPEETAFDIFKRIPSYRSALILAKLPPELAEKWTLRLARQND